MFSWLNHEHENADVEYLFRMMSKEMIFMLISIL